MMIIPPAWDAAFYYAYTRSTIFDGDLALENDLHLNYQWTNDELFISRQMHANLTETGRVFTPFAIGSAIFMLPILSMMRLGLVAVGNFNTGYEWPYLAVTASFSAILGLLTYLLTYRFVREMTGRKIALIAVITLMFTTPLIYYQFREPLYSHAATAFFSAVVVAVWWRQSFSKTQYRLPGVSGALLLGGLIGFLILVRWQQAIYIVLPLASAVLYYRQFPATEWTKSIRIIGIYLLLVGIACALVVSLQLAQWWLFNGSWLLIPQGEGFMDLRALYIREVLFAPFHGLLFWMPIYFPAVFGLFLLARKRLGVVLPLIIIMLLALFINSSTPDWFAGGGYGPRRFSGEIIILGLGYAGFLAAIRPRIRLWLAGLLGVLFTWHHWILLRFGLEEKLGGHILSMSPFLAESDNVGLFLSQLAAHLPDLFLQPADFLILPGSPLDSWVTYRIVPWPHVTGLVIAVLFIIGIWWLWRRSRLVWPWLVVALVIILIGNLWVIVWA